MLNENDRFDETTTKTIAKPSIAIHNNNNNKNEFCCCCCQSCGQNPCAGHPHHLLRPTGNEIFGAPPVSRTVSANQKIIFLANGVPPRATTRLFRSDLRIHDLVQNYES